MLKNILLVLLSLSFSLFSLADNTQPNGKPPSITHVLLTDAWVRATADGQEVGTAYTNLMSAETSTLISAETDVAGSVEIHSMSMHNGVMKMRRLQTLALPKGQTISLAPGAFHLMLFDLKKPLKVGENAKFTLTFKAENGVKFSQILIMPILATSPEKPEHIHAH